MPEWESATKRKSERNSKTRGISQKKPTSNLSYSTHNRRAANNDAFYRVAQSAEAVHARYTN